MERMAKIVPFRPRRRWTRASDYRAKDRWWLLVLAAPLAAFTTVFLWPADWPRGEAVEWQAGDTESASFALCGSGARVDCVVDGDTFWYRGEKYRVADINTPEVSSPGCAAEAALGAQATQRLHALLNEGPFTLEPLDRERDAYDRLLRTVTRDGESLGAVLVREGLAEEWRGVRGSWC
jgi:endonuclease YncB( thermonuclease family)